MLAKSLVLAGLASAATAQSMNFSAAITSVPALSNLTNYLGLFGNLTTELEALTNVTLLAPSNDAFAKILSSPAAVSLNNTAYITDVFSYHIINGTYYASQITKEPQFLPTFLTAESNLTLLQNAAVEGILLGSNVTFFSGILTESIVTQANINYTGGTIHVIDTFLTPPQNISATIVELDDTASAGALEKANAAASASQISNLTAFIPNNAAWQAISSVAGSLNMTQLQGILGYHLVPDVVAYSTLLSQNTTLPTLVNTTLQITNLNGTIFVNNAKVVTPNVIVQEGVVHIIDEVLNPGNTTVAPNPSTTQVDFPTGAANGTAIPFTSGIPAPSSVPAQTTGATSSAGATSSGKAPIQTAAMGAAALFGGAAVMLNM